MKSRRVRRHRRRFNKTARTIRGRGPRPTHALPQSGGGIIPSIDQAHERYTVVDVRPDADKPDSVATAMRLPIAEKLLGSDPSASE